MQITGSVDLISVCVQYVHICLLILTLPGGEVTEQATASDIVIITPWLMEPGGSTPHSQGLSNNSYPEPIPRIDTYLFMVHSNIVLPSTPSPPQRSLSSRFAC